MALVGNLRTFFLNDGFRTGSDQQKSELLESVVQGSRNHMGYFVLF